MLSSNSTYYAKCPHNTNLEMSKIWGAQKKGAVISWRSWGERGWGNFLVHLNVLFNSSLYNKCKRNWPYHMFIKISRQVFTVVWSFISHLKVFRMGFPGKKVLIKNPQNLKKISIIKSSYLRKNVISSKILWNFPDKLKTEMFLIVSAACPENLAAKR